MRAFIAFVLIAASVWVLESAKAGVEVTSTTIGETPVTSFARPDAAGPHVVVAHGFAGSSQMMQGYALPLARAGYRVHAFDFLGHGRHPLPMSGDVTSVDGTTRLLVNQTAGIIDAVSEGAGPVALLGHSMATDILVRVAEERGDVATLVLLSAFSREIDSTHPASLLLVTGAWEPGLRDFALEALRMVDPAAEEGETVSEGGTTRRAVVAPLTEHVSILHSTLGRAEALAWLGRVFGRAAEVTILPTGPAIVGLLAGLVLFVVAAARRLPVHQVERADPGRTRLAVAALLPALVAPPVAVWLEPSFLPVLVADYLALHLAIYGAVQLGLLGFWRIPLGPFAPAGFLFLLAGCGLVIVALDRYAANFLPTPERLWIVAALLTGAVPFFVADARLSHRAPILRRLALHGAFLASLGLAVALDFEGLFFLLMIAPVVVLFYLVFGAMGHATSARSGPLAAGLALGLVLALALGVSFPLFEA